MPPATSINWATPLFLLHRQRRKIRGKLDVPAFTPFSYQHPGVPSGTLSEKSRTSAKFTMA